MRATAAACLLGLACCATSSGQSADKTQKQPEADQGGQPAKPIADPGQRLAFHVAGLIQAMQATPECSKADAAGTAYVEKNHDAMRQAVLELKKKSADLSSEASEQYFAQVMKLVDELFPNAEAALKSFDERCATESHALGKALDALDKEETK